MSPARQSLLLALIPLMSTACADTIVYEINNTYVLTEPDESDTGEPVVDPYADLPATPTMSANQLPADVLGQDDNTWWLNVSESVVSTLNEPWTGGGGYGYGQYEVGGSGSGTENLLIITPAGQVADYGAVGINLIGQTSGAPWTTSTIPNFRLDADEYVDGQRFGEVEHIRLNNAGVGTMFGEASSLAVFRAMGVPAARTAYAWVGGSAWEDDELLVPMLAREVYKREFCEDNADLLGGGCKNIRESTGEFTNVASWAVAECDYGDCEDLSGLTLLSNAVKENMRTQTFDEGTEPFFDWPLFHRSACVHWLLWVGDDYIHNLNNVVLAEGEDGRFRVLPYSTDVTAGYAFSGTYINTPLFGGAMMSKGCQLDEGCRETQLDTCEQVLDEFEAMDPASIIDDLAARMLAAQAPWGEHPDGMWREPDDEAYEHFRAFYEGRVETARAELEQMRSGAK
ncbi:MAG: CotH kinase family protein [Deltaproteobacteria bacterium]|nr:CotH kinase family protein [Deltaproteobacteria bacterium]